VRWERGGGRSDVAKENRARRDEEPDDAEEEGGLFCAFMAEYASGLPAFRRSRANDAGYMIEKRKE
jgi:hypothetical protein